MNDFELLHQGFILRINRAMAYEAMMEAARDRDGLIFARRKLLELRAALVELLSQEVSHNLQKMPETF